MLLLGGICSAEKVVVDVAGYGAEKFTIVPVTLEWNDSWFEPFEKPKYNHQLARAAGALSSLAYDSHPKVTTDNILVQAYSKFGVSLNDIDWFYDIDYDDSVYGINQAAFSIAKKRLPGGRELVFVVIRGTPGNEEEWLSNINVWNTFLTNNNAKEKQYHEGFLLAVTKVKENLLKYVEKNNIDLKKASILVTGHSRGAASANLLSAILVDEEIVSPDRIFTYTFAAPNVTVRKDARDEKYNFIFNIVNGEDIVPSVPPNEKKWQFTKFGQIKAIVNSWNCDDIQVYQNEYIPKMNLLYKKLLGREYQPFGTGSFIPSKIGDSFTAINPTKRKFYRSWFPLHKRLEKTIINEFPSTREAEYDRILHGPKTKDDESVTGIAKFFRIIKKKADTKTQVLIKHSLNAFIDMHAMQSYLSWLLALDELDLYSDRPSSIVRLKGVFNAAIIDGEGNIYARIYDGVLMLRETKAPLAAWQIPIGNFGPISLGFPHSQNYSLLIYKDSLVPTPIQIQIERYNSEGIFMNVINKKIAAPHIGMVYKIPVGKTALEKVEGAPMESAKLRGWEARIAIKDGKLKNTDVSHMSFGTHIDTEGYWEFGMTSGLPKIYLATLVGFNTKDFSSSQSFSLGFGTQHCFCGPIMLNAEAYARFVRYTEYSVYNDWIVAEDWAFGLVPSTRFMLSVKPAKRIQFFSALEMSYHIRELNEEVFSSGYKSGGMTPWYINSQFSISPSIQFGVKL